jgi:hypothetical protein
MKAARYVFNDYRDRSPGTVTNMIDTLQWDSLACRRTKASMMLLYKINGGLVEGTNEEYSTTGQTSDVYVSFLTCTVFHISA